MIYRHLVKVLIPGLGLLAGVQFWILTDSVLIGIVVGSAVGAFFLWFVRGFDKKSVRKRRFIGEVSETIVEDEFVEVLETNERVVSDNLQATVKQEPRQVANSIKSMLAKQRGKR